MNIDSMKTLSEVFKIRELHSDIPQFKPGNIQPHGAFIPIPKSEDISWIIIPYRVMKPEVKLVSDNRAPSI